MFSPNERLTAGIVGMVLFILMLPLLSSAASEPPPPGSAPLFQVRCWQYGRLLFEERDVQLPSDVTAGLKLRGTDRNHQPIYVIDTGNATCLIRSSAPSVPKR